jgi:hypothetical protein
MARWFRNRLLPAAIGAAALAVFCWFGFFASAPNCVDPDTTIPNATNGPAHTFAIVESNTNERSAAAVLARFAETRAHNTNPGAREELSIKPAGGTIRGLVLDCERNPADADLTLIEIDSNLDDAARDDLPRTTTNSDGNYLFPSVPPGKWRVLATPRGRASTTGQRCAPTSSENLVIKEGLTTVARTVGLLPLAKVTIQATDADGISVPVAWELVPYGSWNPARTRFQTESPSKEVQSCELAGATTYDVYARNAEGKIVVGEIRRVPAPEKDAEPFMIVIVIR